METLQRLADIKHVLLDMDGTVYCGDRLYATSKPFFQCLDDLGITYSFLTNNSAKNAEDCQGKLATMGIDVPKESIYNSTMFAGEYLRTAHPELRRLYVLGTESMKLELTSLGFEIISRKPDAVVVGYDVELSYKKLCETAFWLKKGTPFFATHPDRFCPSETPNFIAIDCGWISDFLCQVTGNKPTVLGKPSPEMIRYALRKRGLAPSNAAMCGDRYDTDIKMALEANAFAVQICEAEDALQTPAPDLRVRHLMEFGKALRDARS